jgi:hypothetical protein
MKDRFRAKHSSRRPSKSWEDTNERADDQIAPNAAAQSIEALQRWALTTANIWQSGHRANEAQTVQRIRSRYENAGSNAPLQDLSIYPGQKGTNNVFQATATTQERSPSNNSSEVNEHRTKRRRSKSPARTGLMALAPLSDIAHHRAVTADANASSEDDLYAQSSEWSFPSDEEMSVKARTYIEID